MDVLEGWLIQFSVWGLICLRKTEFGCFILVLGSIPHGRGYHNCLAVKICENVVLI